MSMQSYVYVDLCPQILVGAILNKQIINKCSGVRNIVLLQHEAVDKNKTKVSTKEKPRGVSECEK